MPRVLWCSLPLVYVLCLIFSVRTLLVGADCYYEDERHEEGSEVATAEPCLNCTCNRGVLLCYLRVCPKLPDPPPPGCILLHRYRTCCPELICTDIPNGGNSIEARSDFDGTDLLEYEENSLNACIVNGSVYGPGSAMDSSSLCEYCFCLGGKQTCVKPKCLLSVDGCTPMYEDHNCCPIHYNCTALPPKISTTTTQKPKETEVDVSDGCLVDGNFYSEGGKVFGVGHSVCDNCYCLRGILRCEPLSCAPPLLGCTPVIKPGQCCAASYNCSGTIEIQPEPNYGKFPIVSKEYAKLRKEIQRKPLNKISTVGHGVVQKKSGVPFYVIAESPNSTTGKSQRTSGTFGTTRQFTGSFFNPSTTKPAYYNSIILDSFIANKNKQFTRSYPENSEHKKHSTTSNSLVSQVKTSFSSAKLQPASPTHVFVNIRDESNGSSSEATIYEMSHINTMKFPAETTEESTFGKMRKEDATGVFETTSYDNVTNFESVNVTDISVTENSVFFDDNSTNLFTENTSDIPTTEDYSTIESDDSTQEDVTGAMSAAVILKTVINTTDCKDSTTEEINLSTYLPSDANEINNLLYSTTNAESNTEESTRLSLESRLKTEGSDYVKGEKIPTTPDVATNYKDQEYEYDYNEPTLPPSLPNLRIIPFVAADALDNEKETQNSILVTERRVDPQYQYPNSFSPPEKTEGGFVPKDPPLLDPFYENVVSMPSLTMDPKPERANCLFKKRDIPHGEPVPSESPCITCACFYGNIICQKIPCPLPALHCTQRPMQDAALCCPLYVCKGELIDDIKSNLSSESIQQKFGSTFKDVIKTEQAPNLQSLIVDMTPHSSEATPDAKTEEILDKASKNGTGAYFLGEGDLQSLPVDLKNGTSVSAKDVATAAEFSPMMGILKLAGCNIYGRMYRVGRIISELSGPCQECKCTETGVQCTDLVC